MAFGLDIANLIDKKHGKLLISAISAVGLIVVFFWLVSGGCFALLNWLGGYADFDFDWREFLCNPSYIFLQYKNWWNVLIKSLRHINIDKVLLLPFAAISLTLILTFVWFLRQEYAIRFWYLVNFRFARIKDVKKMAVFNKTGIVLGRFAGMLLGAESGSSALCIGEMGSGKTSSVSIPTVLQAEMMNVIAVDLTGVLPQYTAGYRAKIGNIAYFDWDATDDMANNMFYSRWNPLIAPHLPEDVTQRDIYVKRLASYFIAVDSENPDSYWDLAAYDFLAAILFYWIVKIEQVQANNYFLQKLAQGDTLGKEDKDALLSYYILMPKSVAKDAIANLNDEQLNADNYLPIGSWGGVMEPWLGKELCFAMIADWLIYNYDNSADNDGKDWNRWIRSLWDESKLFAYGSQVVESFNRMLQLSAQQRTLVLGKVVKSMMLFTDEAIRERTNGNDIDFACLRGSYDEEQNWRPMTVYAIGKTANAKIINQIFIDEMLHYLMYGGKVESDKPVMLILDDVGHNMRLNCLTEVLEKGRSKGISSLLLCNSLSLVANTYSRDELEMMVMYTDYKIIKAADNRHLSQQMDKLASFAARSVELPKGYKNSKRKIVADANYFHRLAKDFKLCNEIKLNSKDYQIVLVRGFYNYPIMADSVYFAEAEEYAKYAAYPVNYGLSLQKVLQKDETELITPSIGYIQHHSTEESGLAEGKL